MSIFRLARWECTLAKNNGCRYRERDVCGMFEKILKSLGHIVKAQESLVKNFGDKEYDLMICDLGSINQNKKKLFGVSP